jgi:hypothetical protein
MFDLFMMECFPNSNNDEFTGAIEGNISTSIIFQNSFGMIILEAKNPKGENTVEM